MNISIGEILLSQISVMEIDRISSDVWQTIFDFLPLRQQLNLYETCKFFNRLYVKSIELPVHIDDDALNQSKYRRLSRLNLHRNIIVEKVGFLTELRSLSLYGDQIKDLDSVKELKLVHLAIWGIAEVGNLSCMTTLRSLDLPYGVSGEECFRGLTGLTKLDVHGNSRVRNIDFLINLTVLIASGEGCGINQASIQGLTRLTKLCVSVNPRVTDVSHLTNLVTLYVRGDDCGVTQYGIRGLDLRSLDISDNTRISQVSHMKRLISLKMDGEGWV